jgi:hypothetical protein
LTTLAEVQNGNTGSECVIVEYPRFEQMTSFTHIFSKTKVKMGEIVEEKDVHINQLSEKCFFKFVTKFVAQNKF